MYTNGTPMRGNIHKNIPDASGGEVFQDIAVMASAEGARVERIVSDGQSSPPGFWYDQDWDEWVLVLTGGAELELAESGGVERLAPGDWLFLPAHCRHRVHGTQKGTVWLAVHGARP